MFLGSSKISADLGIQSDPKRTVSHQLVLEVDLNASPRPSANATAAAAIAAHALKLSRPESTATQESGFIADEELGIEIRIFCDSGNHFASVNGKAKEFSQRAEMTLSDRDWQTLTWGQFKDRLLKFPGTYDGGEVLSPDGKKKFTNRDTLYGSGIKGDKSRTVSFQCLFKLDGTAPPTHPGISPRGGPSISPRGGPSISPRGGATTTTTSTTSTTSTTGHQRKTSATTSHVRKTSATAAPSLSISDVINAEIRLFINAGIYELQVVATGAHKGTVEVSIPADKFPSYTFENLKKRFGSKWPAMKPGGALAKGNVTFTDNQTLREVGIDVRETEKSTKTFDLVLNLAATN